MAVHFAAHRPPLFLRDVSGSGGMSGQTKDILNNIQGVPNTGDRVGLSEYILNAVLVYNIIPTIYDFLRCFVIHHLFLLHFNIHFTLSND